MLRYLGNYTHRVAISNYWLVALAEGNVTFRWRDSAHGNKKRLDAIRSSAPTAMFAVGAAALLLQGGGPPTNR